MDGVVEVIAGRERRRRWNLQNKVWLVVKINEPGSMIRAVAARHGVCEGLLFTSRQTREGHEQTDPRRNSTYEPNRQG